MDIPTVDCYDEKNHLHPDCQCTPTLLQHPPHGCKSGDVQNARRKVDAIIRSRGYEQFLEFMCPMHTSLTPTFPPPGSDQTLCPRPIFGVYDDHDFGWNNGNGCDPSTCKLKHFVFTGQYTHYFTAQISTNHQKKYSSKRHGVVEASVKAF